MRKFGIGQPLKRFEDRRFLTGKGRYTDDIGQAGQLYGRVVRSPVAHGRIASLDLSAVREAGGVRLVLTVEDLDDEGIAPVPCLAPLPGIRAKERPVLARDRVRHVGEPIAFVVADSMEAALAAAELAMIEFEDLPAVTDCRAAGEDDAPALYEDVPNNLCFFWEAGDKAATDAAFASAAHVARVAIRNNRVAPVSMEPRAILVRHEADTGFEIHLGSQGVAGLHGLFAKMLGEPLDRIRLITPDVGGGFGMKSFMFPEYILAAMAARRLGSPVKWTSDRRESFQSDTHGRDLVSEAELALDEEGHFLGYRIRTIANMGSALSSFAPAIATIAPLQVVPGPYRIPVLHQEVTGVYSNTPPVDAYRGAGRPEAAYLLERLVAQAARDLGLGQDEIRARNFVPAEAMPYRNAAGAVYDSGDFARIMKTALARADWAGFPERRKETEARGRLRGIGIAYYVECTLGAPSEDIDIAFRSDGRVCVAVGTQSNGQGHETAYAQVLGDRLGIDPHLIDVIQGDTAVKATGGGTGGSRSLQMIGNACVAGAEAVIARGRALIAHLRDVPESDVRFEDDHFEIRGTNLRLTVLELAAEARAASDLPEALASGLDLTAGYTREASTFPNGCHVAEVEIDPETGVIEVERYTIVDDFGVVINPMLVAGQVHGGVVQGIGQALGEDVRFDAEGQLLTASFMDYFLPRADICPEIDFTTIEIPCRTNPLGLKGCGEAGTIGACPSVMNAVLDALSPSGIGHLDMPATPAAIHEAISRLRVAAQ